jgi:hypothetical protein
MNFVTHLKDIEEKLFRKDKYIGCYVYSKDEDDDAYKLGMSETDLFDRVKDAKFCFPKPNTFFIHMFIVCDKKKTVRPLEKKLLAESEALAKIKVVTEDGIVEQGIRSTEYRLTTNRRTLGKAVQTVLHDNRNMWDTIVVFGKDGWSVHNKAPRNLNVSKKKTMHAIEPFHVLKVGDTAYVITYEKGKPVISTKGKVIRIVKYAKKITKYEISWGKDAYKYPINEVYLLKREAEIAKKYWYEEQV